MDTSNISRKKIAIFGAGNLGQAMAGHLALNGFDVTLSNRTVSKLQPIIDNGNAIEVKGYPGFNGGTGQLTAVGDLSITMRDRDVIMVCVPATAHQETARLLLPYLRPHHHVILHPGQLFGAMEFRRIVERHDKQLAMEMTFSEFDSSQLTCRAETMGQVYVFAIKQHNGLATIPSQRASEIRDIFKGVYDEFIILRDNVLETGFCDMNAIVHPIVTLLNAGSVERKSPFLYYHEGVTQHIAALVEKADDERMQLARRLDLNIPSIKEWFKSEYGAFGAKGDNLHDLIHSNQGYKGIGAPKELYSRYFWEDIPTGVLPMLDLGLHFDVSMPVLSSTYELCKNLFGEDWLTECRSIHSLGLSHLSAKELLHYARTGEMRRPPDECKFCGTNIRSAL